MIYSFKLWLNLFIFLGSFSFNLSLYDENIPCTQVGHCKCEFPNGLGIDLSPLSGTHYNVSLEPNLTLLYSPCQNNPVNNITNSTQLNECEVGVSLCLEERKDNRTYFYNMGFSEDSSFLWDKISDDAYLIFRHGNRSSRIRLVCDEFVQQPSLGKIGAPSWDNYYELTLETNYACVNTVESEGRSIFTTFGIIFLFLFLVYFLGGYLVLKLIRGANGWEAIPNGDFWRSVINSIRKLFAYFLNGCRRTETYDSI